MKISDSEVTAICAKFKLLKNYYIWSNSTLIKWYALYGRIALLNIGVCVTGLIIGYNQ